ncbi:MAG: hypothetical protein K2G00_02500 [Duncaniella sp.]|nr:hypothetical protein [Bacteroides sp.]MDE5826500.1 hypothetical protein [Duncaniella sp.]MBD5318967.1 hypothetical protein [Bacteroides sp.]MDE6061615.1 hypothetical protein [Duncaniella sp.]MDE6430650.1 hypothetical protein [Duncaniella sp.]
MKRYLQHLFQLILSPGNGWEDIGKANVATRDIAANGYYPLITLTAVSVFMQGVYHRIDFLVLFMRMIVSFVVFFVAYFFGVFVLSLFVEPTLEGRYDEKRCHTFVLYTLGLLALISLIINVLPVTSAMLFFLPFYVALIQWKGCSYMRIRPDRIGIFMIIAILGVLMPLYLFYFLFSHIIG